MAINAISLIFLAIALSIVPSFVKSKTCESSTFAHCQYLKQLNSQIHYTYNATNSSLSIAFISKPTTPSGWIAWAINLNGTGMIGSQAFVAYNLHNDTIRTKTLNIVSFKKLTPGKLAFPFWNVSAVRRKDSTMALYASLSLPGNLKEINQVWQVGPGTEVNGKIMGHGSSPDNLNAKGVLSLTGALTPPPASAPSPAVVATTPLAPRYTPVAPPTAKKNAGGKLEGSVVMVLLCLVSVWMI